MKIFNPRFVKRIVISLAGLAALSGCAVVPYNAGYYDQPSYGGPIYASQPVYVAPPVVNFGLSYSSRGHYGPRHHGRNNHGHGHRYGHRHGRR